ncbi:hypothetical protein, partial [Brevundimonas sp.]
ARGAVIDGGEPRAGTPAPVSKPAPKPKAPSAGQGDLF